MGSQVVEDPPCCVGVSGAEYLAHLLIRQTVLPRVRLMAVVVTVRKAPAILRLKADVDSSSRAAFPLGQEWDSRTTDHRCHDVSSDPHEVQVDSSGCFETLQVQALFASKTTGSSPHACPFRSDEYSALVWSERLLAYNVPPIPIVGICGEDAVTYGSHARFIGVLWFLQIRRSSR